MNKKQIATIIITGTLLVSGSLAYNNKINKKLNNLSTQNQQILNSNKKLKNNITQTNLKLNKQTKKYKLQEKQMKKLNKIISDKQKYIDAITSKVSYNPNNIKQLSHATTIHMKRALKDTSMKSLASDFVIAEKTYGVNALFLAGLVANESKWGKSNRAKTQNNLTGHCVYNRASRGSSFNSKRDCIMRTAKMLKENYLDSNGKHHNGTDIWGINKGYCQKGNNTNYEWSKTINSIALGLKKKANKF